MRREAEPSKLDESSRRVLAALVDHPFRPRANLLMERRSDGSWRFVATIPSPTGDSRRNLGIWLDDEHGPSLEFGGWHTHADLWDLDPAIGLRRMLDYLQRIANGEIVLAEAPTIGDGMPFRVIDVCDREEILDELTSPLVSGQMRLLSWSGAEDTVLDDLLPRVTRP